jgi:biopolymer transport protein ExbB
MNLMDAFIKGGMVMYLILLCLIAMMYFTVERWVVLRKAQVDIGQFMMRLRNSFQHGNIDAVLAFCPQGGAPITNIIRRGALKYDLGIEKVRDAIEDATTEEVFRLQKRLPILESIARVAPMLGLLGALVGIASIFLRIGSLGGTASQGDTVQSISVALMGAVFGLGVGIPAYVLYKYLKTRVARLVHEMNLAKTLFLDLLQRASAAEAPLPVQVEANPVPYVTKPAPTLVFEDDLYFRKKR